MPIEKFNAELRDGHKDCAAAVPFDPGEQWAVVAQPLWPGRRGFRVHARINDTDFETVIVARSRKFWLIVPAAVARAAAVSVGESACFAVGPHPGPRRVRSTDS